MPLLPQLILDRFGLGFTSPRNFVRETLCEIRYAVGVLTYTHLKHNRRKFLALTGLTPKEFQAVLPAFERAYARRHPPTKTITGNPRKRKAGGGRKSTLAAPEQKLLFVLVYLKTYPLQAMLGELFELSQPCANRWIHRLLPVLQQALKVLGVRPERNPRRFAQRERKHGEPLDLIIDGTERPRQRPKNRAQRELFFSGRKRRYADKNLLIANAKTNRIGFLSQTYAGTAPDKKMADRERIVYPAGTRLYQDTGFQGYAPPGVEICQPKKNHARANFVRPKSGRIVV